jgi:RimJ/RimL family protein N-acetyltransferase
MSRPIEIRRLDVSDAPAYWKIRLAALELEPQAFGEAAEEHREKTVDIIEGRLANERNYTLGAFDGGELVGIVTLFREERIKRRHIAQIVGMFVAPSHRGMGVGRALVSQAIELARATPGLRKVQLSVITTQPAARQLYRSLGFQPFGIDPGALQVDGEYLDEEYMYLPLMPEPKTDSRSTPDIDAAERSECR